MRLSLSLSPAQNSLICQEPDGTYEDPRQCDKYYECYDGKPEERLCPDGLVFDPFSRKREPCDHYFNVDCGDRLELRKSPIGFFFYLYVIFFCEGGGTGSSFPT